VWSHHFSNGQWCERGAEFVDRDHVEVLALARSLGLDLTDVTCGHDPWKRLLDIGGRALPYAFHHALAADLDRWHAALAAIAAGVDPEDPAGGPDAPVLDAARLSDLIAGLQLGVHARVAIGRDIRTEFMLGPDEISQLMAAWMTALYARAGGGREAHRIAGGNDQLATGLAARLGDRVRTNSRVVAVDPQAGRVELATGELITAGHVVAAVPLPVLGRMWGEMPVELARVGYGIGGKISVQAARRVWNDYGHDGAVDSERAWGQMWDTSDAQPGDSGVLTALLSSHDGAALVSLADTTDRIVDEADRLFPGFKGLAGERVQTDWTNDALSLGCYAAFGPGQLVPAWPMLRRTYGAMVLAGEHTDAYAGYMEGALRSGARAARTILAVAAQSG
jgi:monoamine oxidase